MFYIYQYHNETHGPAFTVVDDKIYQGRPCGQNPVYEIHGEKIVQYLGNGVPVYTVNGDNIYRGYDHAGVPMFKIRGDSIYAGISTNTLPIYVIRNHG